MKKIYVCLSALAMVSLCAADASAQTYRQYKQKSRKQYFAVSTDWLNTLPLHIKNEPLEQLSGVELGVAQRKDWDYESRNDGGLTRVDVLEFRRRSRGLGLAVYPFGSSSGPSLMIKGSSEALPVFRVRFDGPSAISNYELIDSRAYDAGIGVIVADRSPGWGLGSHAYVIGGVGKIDTSNGFGTRIFAEGGGGLSFGPVGVEIGVKFAKNKLKQPVAHEFYTVPVTLRATFGF